MTGPGTVRDGSLSWLTAVELKVGGGGGHVATLAGGGDQGRILIETQLKEYDLCKKNKQQELFHKNSAWILFISSFPSYC